MEGGTEASPAMCVEPGRPSSAFGVEGSSADTTGINHARAHKNGRGEEERVTI